MGLFDEMLGSGESLFKNAIVLDFDYQPKVIPYREQEMQYIVSCIKPLFQQRNGKNLFLYGPPGVGKTAACKHILEELGEQTDEIDTLYVNCWQNNTTFKIMYAMCEALGLKFIHNKRTEELFKMLKERLNKKTAVFVFDEIDKAEDYDFIYSVLEELYRKTVILITNHKEWLDDLDTRIKSRLNPETLAFRKDNQDEMMGIIKQRINYAFVEGVWRPEAFSLAAAKTTELGDIRTGLYLLKEAGTIAEDKASKKIELAHVEEAIKKLDSFSIKKSSDLEEETRMILDVVKGNSGKKIGELFEDYQKAGGKSVYKTFQRKIAKLEQSGFIATKKIVGGTEGSTTIVNYAKGKKLTDF